MEVYALNRLDQVGLITTYTRVSAIERDLGVGAWSLEMPLGDPAGPAAKLLAVPWPGVEFYDPGTGARYGGFVTDAIVTADDQGVETVQFVGKDFQADLAGWLDWPDPADFGGAWFAVVGGTIPATSDAHNMVATNAGAAALSTRQRIYGLVQGPDPAAGEPKARRLRFDPLLTVLQFLFLGTGYTARLRLIRDGDTGAGSVLFETPERSLSSVWFNAKRGTVGKIEVRRSASKVTTVIAVGKDVVAGAPGERVVSGVISIDYESSWRYRHRETFINRPGSDEVTLNDEVSTEWANGSETLATKVDSARVEGYGTLIDLGWMVDVALGSTFSPPTARLPVVASTLTFTPEQGWQRTVDLGVESLDAAAKLSASIGQVRAEVRKIQGEL